MEPRSVRRVGFTLIEVLVVVAIIGAIFGLAMPTLNSFMSNQRLKAVTGRLSTGLLMARTRAITKHQELYAIFFADRFMLVSSRPEVPDLYDYFSSAREAAKMVLRFRFADAVVRETGTKDHPQGLESDLARLPDEDWTKPIAARSILESGGLEGKVAYVHFTSDGTAVFGSGSGPGDRLSVEFWAEPPRDADIIVEEQGNAMRGWIDVRPTGNVDSRIKGGEVKESPAEAEAEEASEATS